MFACVYNVCTFKYTILMTAAVQLVDFDLKPHPGFLLVLKVWSSRIGLQDIVGLS